MPIAFGVTVSVSADMLAPAASGPAWVQVTIVVLFEPVALVQVQPLPLVDTSFRPEGSVSTTVTGPTSASTPLLVTVSV